MKSFSPDRVKAIKQLLALAVPFSVGGAVQTSYHLINAFWVGRLGSDAVTVLAAKFGTVVLASYGLVFRILTFTIIPTFSISMATSILVGQSLGAGDSGRARSTVVQSALISCSLMLVVGAILFIFARPILGLFVPGDPELIEQGALVLRIFTLSFPLTGLQLALTGSFRGAGDTFTAMILTLTGIWLVQLPSAYILSHYTPLGANGLWWSSLIASCASTTLALLYFRSDRWMRAREMSAEPGTQNRQ